MCARSCFFFLLLIICLLFIFRVYCSFLLLADYFFFTLWLFIQILITFLFSYVMLKPTECQLLNARGKFPGRFHWEARIMWNQVFVQSRANNLVIRWACFFKSWCGFWFLFVCAKMYVTWSTISQLLRAVQHCATENFHLKKKSASVFF